MGDRGRRARREDSLEFAAAMARLHETWRRTLELTSEILRLAEANQQLIESLSPQPLRIVRRGGRRRTLSASNLN